MAVVLVTGGTRGIGAACVRWFLDNGDQVATTYRSADPPPAPEGADAERFLAVRCDVTEAEQIEAAFKTIESTWSPVEVLVANAGITRDGLLLRMSEDAFTEVRTPFAGQVIGWLAAAGERVQEGQPLVWMRVPDRI